MCEQLGWEPNEEEMPADPSSLALECQQALILSSALPDRWDGMSGTWLGKDYSGLDAIMTIYDFEDRRVVFDYLQVIESELAKFYESKKKEQEAMSKAKGA